MEAKYNEPNHVAKEIYIQCKSDKFSFYSYTTNDVSKQIGWLTIALFVGSIFFIIVGVWVLIDAFLIPGIVRNENENLKEEYSKRVIAGREFAAAQSVN